MVTLAPLFTWRSAVVDSALPPTCRHVLLTLSLHMNERGGSCFPSYDTLAAETGLNRATVIRQLKAAEDAGWLIVERSKGRASNRYEAATPNSRTAQPSPSATVAHDAPQQSFSVHPTVAQGDPSTSMSTSRSTSLTRGGDRFAEFWAAYPRREAKAAALKAWARAIKSTDPETIIAGARRYAADPNREKRFTAHAATWLNAGRWDDEPLPGRGHTIADNVTRLARMAQGAR